MAKKINFKFDIDPENSIYFLHNNKIVTGTVTGIEYKEDKNRFEKLYWIDFDEQDRSDMVSEEKLFLTKDELVKNLIKQYDKKIIKG